MMTQFGQKMCNYFHLQTLCGSSFLPVLFFRSTFFALNLIYSGCSHFVCSVPVKNRKCLAHEAVYTSACLACSIPAKTGNVWLMMQYTLLPLILALFMTSQKQAATSARHKIMALASVLSPL